MKQRGNSRQTFGNISRHVSFGQPSFMARLRPLRNEIDTRRRLGAAPLGGLIAIVVNTILLEAADWIPLVTACGGPLKLLFIRLSKSALRSCGHHSDDRVGWFAPEADHPLIARE